MTRFVLQSAMWLAASFLIARPAAAQLSQLEYAPAKVPRGMVMHFNKTQLDGKHPTKISVYVVDQERLENLKWQPGSRTATLVSARMDWAKFSARELKSWHLKRDAEPELRATLEALRDGSELRVSFLRDQPVPIRHWPWHSYDFDFASLGLTLPHLRDPRADFIFWRTDSVFLGEGLHFQEVGGIRMRFEALELRDALQLRRYSIGGAGLGHEYGRLWTDAKTGLLIEYRLPVGDEPGYDTVRLVRERTEAMTLPQWEAFKRSRVR